MQEVGCWSHAFGMDTPAITYLEQFHLLDFNPHPPTQACLYKQSAEGGEAAEKGGREGYLPVQGFSPYSRLHPTRTIVPKFPTPTPDRK